MNKKDSSRRKIIIKAAAELFGRYGFSKTTVEEIARSSRMGKASIYYYFKNKEEIYREVLENESRLLQKNIVDAIEKKNSAPEKIKEYAKARSKSLLSLPNIAAALKDELIHHLDSIQKFRKKFLRLEVEIIKKLLKEGKDKKIFNIKYIEQTAFVILTSLKGLESLILEKPDWIEWERHLNKLLEILFLGLQKR
ncbi:MAG: TetR/AcrR family transcriptional regulator [Candidatus Aminicenantales bacterium]